MGVLLLASGPFLAALLFREHPFPEPASLLGQLITSVMMPFVANLPGLKMNCSCRAFHLCRIATRAESQLITFSLESRGPFILGSAECVMEKGWRQAAAGQLGIA